MQPNTVARSAIAVVAACTRYDGYGKKKEIVRPEWGLFTITAGICGVLRRFNSGTAHDISAVGNNSTRTFLAMKF